MGMSMRQTLLMIGLEQTVIASISLVVGAVIGMMLSAVLLPYLAGKDASTLAPPMEFRCSRWGLESHQTCWPASH